MDTPYTLMRCRMKDLISCFKACKVPIEEDDDESDYPKPKALSIDHQQRQRDKGVLELETTTEKGDEGEESPTSWQSCESEEDEYIVFYFRDNDAARVDVIEERGSENSMWRKPDAITPDRRKKHETRKIEVDSKSISTKSNHVNEWSEHDESQEHKDTLVESSDSSTSSFAFPTMQSEWTGSPVLMPRPEGHNKARRVCIQCCKF